MPVVPYIFASDTGNIPLSYLDVNFANVKAFATSAGYVTANDQPNINSIGVLSNLSVSGNIVTGGISANTLSLGGNLSTTGNISSNNIIANSVFASYVNGTINISDQPNITSLGTLTSLSVTGNTVSGNLFTAGQVSATGSIFTTGSVSATGNLLSSGLISAVGDVTGQNFNVGGNITISGNATINGTLTTINSQTLNITDKNIVVANNVSTSALIDGAGIDAGNPTVAYIRYSNASAGWTTANNFSIGGQLSVTGAIYTPTVANAVSNTQVATTAFVHNVVTDTVGTLGTMASQNANSVSITGGSINSLTVTSLGTNSYGTKTVSSSAPSGGSDGDVWYQI